MRVALCGSSLPQVGHPLSCNCFSKGKDGRKRGGARSGTMAQVHSFFVPDIPYFVRFDPQMSSILCEKDRIKF